MYIMVSFMQQNSPLVTPLWGGAIVGTGERKLRGLSHFDSYINVVFEHSAVKLHPRIPCTIKKRQKLNLQAIYNFLNSTSGERA